ncbi:MAG TPA: hypothetical protein VMV07_17130 [Streptosporangiaceae bacterium]|nr:hypothetical protein [Streptosporangiaceae bacterium]
MTTASDSKAIILTADDAAYVRQALVACSGILGLATAAGGPGRQALEEAALETVADGRPLGQVHCHVNLAIDYIDFATPARRSR